MCRTSRNGPNESRISTVVAQPCRRRGVGQLSRRITRGCLTGARWVRRRETPGGGCTNTTCTHTHTLYAQRVVFAPSARTTRQLAPGPSLPLCSPTRSPSLPLLPSVLRPLVDPGDKGASATLCVGSGRLVSRIGRLFETASRVDIALVTNEKVGSSNVDASTWLRLRGGTVHHGEKRDFSCSIMDTWRARAMPGSRE